MNNFTLYWQEIAFTFAFAIGAGLLLMRCSYSNLSNDVSDYNAQLQEQKLNNYIKKI